MISFLYTVYVLVCVFLILVVLLQAGKGGMGSAFGGSSQTVFGGSGAGNFLTRLTVISAGLFMLLSATLTYVSSSGEKSLEKASEKVRLLEEARSAATKQSEEAKKKAAAAPAEQSSPESATPAAAVPAGVEGAEGAEPTAPAAAAPQIDVGGTPIKIERVNPEDVPGLRANKPAGRAAPIKVERVTPQEAAAAAEPAPLPAPAAEPAPAPVAPAAQP